VQTKGWANLIFTLRALFGVNSRAEIFAYLLVRDHDYPSNISWEIDYSQKNIQDTLVEIATSNLLDRFPSGRTVLYRIRNRELWCKLLGLDIELIPKRWVHWRRGFWELRLVWNAIRRRDIDENAYKIFSRIMTHLCQAKQEIKDIAFAPVYNMVYEGEHSVNILLGELSAIYQEIYGLE
jgi:hypothetical protein